MAAKQKQTLLTATSIFFALCSIGFSINGNTFLWFLQHYPFIPMLLPLFVFFAIKYWLALEIQKQRQEILEAYTVDNKNMAFNTLLSPTVNMR